MDGPRSIAPIGRIDSPPPARGGTVPARARRPATIVRIRPIAPADRDCLRAFYAGLSDESRRTRFLGATSGIGSSQSTYFCTPDHAHREGFVAVLGPRAGLETIVGHVCVEPDGSTRAEIAVAVADDLHGHGVGRALVMTAVAWARRDGLRTLIATMFGGNPAIQRLLAGLGLPSTATSVGAGVVEVRIDLGRVRSAA
jgi:GNAT superfamily N-acetyltransferase